MGSSPTEEAAPARAAVDRIELSVGWRAFSARPRKASLAWCFLRERSDGLTKLMILTVATRAITNPQPFRG
jgi:hypothetical protein